METIKNMPVEISQGLVLHRLGYQKTKNTLQESEKQKLLQDIMQLKETCLPTGRSLVLDIISHEASRTCLSGGMCIPGKQSAELLKDSRAVLMMASTIPFVTERIDKLMEENSAEAVLLNSVAAEVADSGLDFIMQSLNAKLLRQGKRLTKMRYSAGYGDMPISFQKALYEVLELQEIGVTINEHFMLIPEKSVIAIAGVEG